MRAATASFHPGASNVLPQVIEATEALSELAGRVIERLEQTSGEIYRRVLWVSCAVNLERPTGFVDLPYSGFCFLEGRLGTRERQLVDVDAAIQHSTGDLPVTAAWRAIRRQTAVGLGKGDDVSPRVLQPFAK